MANVGYATLTIMPSAKGFSKALQKEVGSPLAQGGKKSGQDAGAGFGGGFMGAIKPIAGLAAGLFAADAVGGFFKNAIVGAGNLEQSMGAVQTIFKGSSAQVLGWSQDAATAVGLTSNEYNEFASLLGSQMKNAGVPLDQLGGKTNDLIGLGADLSSMFGGTTSDAVAALSSAMKGEMDPMERYGVSLNAAAIEAKAAQMGIEKVNGELDNQGKQAAILALIMDQTGDAQGNFAKESNTMGGQLARLKANWGNLSTTIGQAFLPIITSALGGLNAIFPSLQKLALGIQGIGAILLQGDFTGALTEAFGWEEDSSAVDALFRIREAVMGFVTDITNIGKTLWAGFTMDPGIVSDLGAKINPLLAIGASVRDAFATLGPVFSQLGPQILGLVTSFSPLSLIFQVLQPIIPQLIGVIAQLASTIGTVLGVVIAAVTPFIQTLVTILSDMAVAILPVVMSAFTSIGSALTLLAPIVAQVLNAVLPLASALLTALAPIVTNLATTVLPLVVSAFSAVVAAVLPVVETILSILIPVIQNLIPIVTVAFDVIANVVRAAMTIVQGIIQVVTGIISGNWSQVWEGIQNILSGVWDLIVSAVSGAIRLVLSIIQGVLGTISGIWTNLWGQIGDYLSSAWDGIVSSVQGGIDNVLQFFRDLPGTITGLLSGAGGWLVDAGANIVQGLLDGIGSLAGTVGSFFLDLLPGWIVGPFKTALGIHSPSRLFRGFGQNIGEGALLGVEDTKASIDRAMAHLVSVPDVPEIPISATTSGGVLGAVATAASGVRNEIHLHGIEGEPQAFADALSFVMHRASRPGVHSPGGTQ